jgi:hypothetical protein
MAPALMADATRLTDRCRTLATREDARDACFGQQRGTGARPVGSAIMQSLDRPSLVRKSS